MRLLNSLRDPIVNDRRVSPDNGRVQHGRVLLAFDAWRWIGRWGGDGEIVGEVGWMGD